MLAENNHSLCPICHDASLSRVKELQSGSLIRYECERCGNYDIDRDLAIQNNPAWYEVKHLVSAWIRQQNNAGITPNIGEHESPKNITSPDWWKKEFKHRGFPETASEKMDVLLIAYANSIDWNCGRQFSSGDRHYIADIAARNGEEVRGLHKLLVELGLIDQNPMITAKGWLHLDELRKKPINNSSAFIAMWFSDTTTKYREAVIAAIEYCQFKPVIIDQQEYNDFVMNQVISSIRSSRFLVADFTSRPEIEKDGAIKNGVRGGVYWEAGFAYGLGLPVIHTSEDHVASRNRIHFDINQYNTIFWKADDLSTEIRPLDQTRDNPTFTEKLAARILATVGRGPYQVTK
jgi:hypothetical protein